MNPLLLPYIFNIIVLVPVGLLTLLGGEKGGRLACQGKFPESEGFRTILGSLWTAILIGSVLGPFLPGSDVAAAADPGYLQDALASGVCHAPPDRWTNQRSTLRHCVGISRDRLELPLGHSVATVVRDAIG